MSIHLLVPSLLDPWSDFDLQQPLPEFPVLERLLAKAERQSAPSDYPRTLFALLDMPFEAQGGLPTANLCWQADTQQPPPANLLHADPVYLKPDMDNVQLFRSANLDREQAQLFAAAFNEFYKDYGYCLYPLAADRWYISAPEPFVTPEVSLDQVSGRNLRPFVTTGRQSREWNGLFTEIQMLFYDLPVNQARQKAADYPVSGVWLSGGGELPVVGQHRIETVQGDDPLLRGLALHAGLSQTDELASPDADHLVVMQDCHTAWLAMDFPAWLDAVQQVEALLEGGVKSDKKVILYPCNGRSWHWRAKNKYYLWRRRRGLRHYVTSQQPGAS